MKITRDVIEHVANLARLKLTDIEKERLASDMSDIIAYVDKLNEIDTSMVEPMSHAVPLNNVLRDDRVKESCDREKILMNAPSKANGYFSVPKVVE